VFHYLSQMLQYRVFTTWWPLLLHPPTPRFSDDGSAGHLARMPVKWGLSRPWPHLPDFRVKREYPGIRACIYDLETW
jgi:hypothetical protein